MVRQAGRRRRRGVVAEGTPEDVAAIVCAEAHKSHCGEFCNGNGPLLGNRQALD